MDLSRLNTVLPRPFNILAVSLYILANIHSSFFIANNYFITSLTKITQQLKWCSDISAILLINIANGLPDLLSTYILAQKDPFVAIAASLGSLVFMLTANLAFVILLSKKMTYLDHSSFYKNIFSLMGAFAFVIYLLATQAITIEASLAMLVAYVMFVGYSYMTSSVYTDSIEGVSVDVVTRKTVYRRIRKIVNMPFRFFLDVCVLNHGEKSVMPRKYCAVFSPLANFYVCCIYMGTKMRVREFYLASLLFLLLGICLCHAVKRCRLNLLLYFYSFIASGLYICLCTSETLSFIYYINTELDITPELSSLTLLAIANCMGDLVTGIAGSRRGLFKTAANACMTAPVHNTLFNLGIVFAVCSYKNGCVPIYLPYKKIVNVAMAMMPLICINLVMNYEIRNRKLAGELAGVLLFVYLLFTYFTILM